MWSDEEADDSDEAEEVETGFKSQFVLIAIDTHSLMFKENADGSLPFKTCLEACHALADSLIVSQNKISWSQFAVMLCREESPSLIQFQDKLTDTVKLLKQKVNAPNKQLVEEYQRKEEVNMAAFFLACKKAFHDIKTPFYKRTIIYITNDDEPVNEAKKRFTVFNEVKSFKGNQIDFQVVSMRLDFDYTKFYNELSSLVKDNNVEEICEDKEGLVEKLSKAVIVRHTRRKMMFYPLKSDTTVFNNCIKLDIIRTNTLNNIRLKNDGKTIKRVVEDSASSYRFKSGNGNVTFDADEKNSFLNTTLPLGLHLLYISKRMTNIGYVLGKPFLLTWNREENLPFIKKIWQYCTDNEKVLVCVRKLKQPDKLRYMELIPVSANSSPMFLAKNIPFVTEIMYPKQVEWPIEELNNEQKAAVAKLVDAQTFDFNVKMIPDPCYRKKKAYLKAKLLDEPMEEVEDVTLNAKALDEHLKDVTDLMNKNFMLVETKKRKVALARSRGTKQSKLT